MSALHIIVIEDDHDTLEYMNELLSLYGYRVTPRPTSAHALELINREQPDLVVLDHRLDRPLNGYELLEALHAQPSTTHIPVILYSAEIDRFDARSNTIRTMGGDTLQKPFLPEELLEKIRALTNGVA